jgi:hypothetical protein
VKDGWLELLFDLEQDPGERRNLFYQHPDVVAQVRQRLADWEAELAKNPPPIQVK